MSARRRGPREARPARSVLASSPQCGGCRGLGGLGFEGAGAEEAAASEVGAHGGEDAAEDVGFVGADLAGLGGASAGVKAIDGGGAGIHAADHCVAVDHR